MIHPAVDILSDEDREYEGLQTGRLIPVYPSGEEYRKVGLDSHGFRKIILSAWDELKEKVPDSLPLAIRKEMNLIPL